jgi:UDP-3-O-[3-hydroxymyristoyl] glucosamine N-acyltransferase
MKLSELAARLGLELCGDGAIDIADAAPLEAAGPGSITFAAAPKYASALSASAASAAIVPPEMAAAAPCAALASKNPVFDFARVLHIFHPPYRPPAPIA